jgi:MFS family permease
VYSTSQFLGAALGGILGGWLFQHGGLTVFLGCAGLAAIWLAFAVAMNEPPYVTSLRMPLIRGVREAGLTERLMAVPGVTDDAVVVAEEAAIYIKLDKNFGSCDPRAPGEPSLFGVRSLGERYGPWG